MKAHKSVKRGVVGNIVRFPSRMWRKNSRRDPALHAWSVISGIVFIGIAASGAIFNDDGAVIFRILIGVVATPLVFTFGYVFLYYGPLGTLFADENAASRPDKQSE